MKFNWFPGHMEKARKQLEEKIKIIDFVIELVDARNPYSSKNPLLESITNKKPKILIMTKKDLCDPKKIALWEDHFESQGYKILTINTLGFKNFNQILKIAEEICVEKREKEKKKGIRPQPLKTMVVGVPNVGKSTFINYFSNKKATSVANKPGHTRQQQWVKVNQNIQLLDTPGILWPKFSDKMVAKNLAFTNSVKLDILPKQDIYLNALDFLIKEYPLIFEKYFKYSIKEHTFAKSIESLNERYNFKKDINEDNTIDKFLYELVNGKIAKLTFETPSDLIKP